MPFFDNEGSEVTQLPVEGAMPLHFQLPPNLGLEIPPRIVVVEGGGGDGGTPAVVNFS